MRIVFPERQTTRQDRDSKLNILGMLLFLTLVFLAVENQMVRSTRVDEFFHLKSEPSVLTTGVPVTAIRFLENKGKIRHQSVEYILFNFILKAA